MKKKYYWINDGNMLEFDGPFATIDIAKREAVDAARSVNDTMSIRIVQVVAKGEVTAKFKWREA